MNHRNVLRTIVSFSSAATAYGQSPGNIFQATLGESGQRTAEVSTEQFRGILAESSAVVLDARPFREFAISHIPGALNVAAEPGVSASAYVSDVAEVGRLLRGKKETPLRAKRSITSPASVEVSRKRWLRWDHESEAPVTGP